MLKKVLLKLIRFYQLTLSSFIGGQCRFYPSCSNYALEAINRHGSMHGTLLTISRICKCHPLHPGGADPVPECKNNTTLVEK